jgi:hypothetical protein
MIDISSKKTIYRRCREEKDLFTSVVPASKAWFTFVANDIRLDRNAVADFETLNSRMDSKDNAGRLVSQNVGICYNHWAYAASMPEVNI